MKVILGLITFTSLFLLCTPDASAQKPPTAAQTADKLHAQFYEMQLKESSLRERLMQLDEDLKEENIARSIGRMGSTRPEELRAQRRRQLENEKAIVVNQLKDLERSRERLTEDIRLAESAAYQESAQPRTATLAGDALGTTSGFVPRWPAKTLAAGITLLGFVMLIWLIRRR